jgi:hypothetical protein
VSALFKNKCASVACHGAGAPQVDLTSAGMESRVVGKNAADSGKCAGRVLVSRSGGPSLLLEKIDDQPPCGDQMPLGGSLPDADRKCVTDWVSSIGK